MILKTGKTYQGRYRIVNVIHEGAKAEVYLGDDLQLTRKIALKVVDLTRDPKGQEKFQQEAKFLAGLSHPNIVTVYSYGTLENGSSYISMEFLGGHTLKDWLETKGKLSLDDFLSAYSQLLKALEYLHGQGVIHRNISPQNIMIQKETDESEPVIKLLDFGVAKDAPLQDDGLNLAQAQTQGPSGNPCYMSPEQCALKPLDARSDLFSLACVMYEAISGKPPFEAETVLEITLKHANDIMNPLDGIHPDVIVFFRKALERDPNRRYQTASEMLAAVPVIDRLDSTKVYRMRAAKKGLKPWMKLALVLSLFMVIGYIGGHFSKEQPWKKVHIYKKNIATMNDGASMLKQMDENNKEDVYKTCKRILELNAKFNREARYTALRLLSSVASSFEKNANIKYAQMWVNEAKVDKLAGAAGVYDAYSNLILTQSREGKHSDACNTAKTALAALKSSNSNSMLCYLYQLKSFSEYELKRYTEAEQDAATATSLMAKTGLTAEVKNEFAWQNATTTVVSLVESGHDSDVSKVLSATQKANGKLSPSLTFRMLDAANESARRHKYQTATAIVDVIEQSLKENTASDSSQKADLDTTKSYILSLQGKKAEAHSAAESAYNELKKQTNKEHLQNFQRFVTTIMIEKDWDLLKAAETDIMSIARMDDPKVDAGCVAALDLGNLNKNLKNNDEATQYFEMALGYVNKYRAENPVLYKRVAGEVAKFYDTTGRGSDARALRATISAKN